MSVLSRALSSVAPWSSASLSSESVCQVTNAQYIGLNDVECAATTVLDSVTTSTSRTNATANIANPKQVPISIFKYGCFVESIQGTRPTQCDFVLYTYCPDLSSFSQVLLAEVKVCKTHKQGNRRDKAKTQLSCSLEVFLQHVPNMKNSVIRCAFFHCSPASFGKMGSNTPLKARRAAQGANRVAAHEKKGIQKKCPRINNLGAEYWEFPYEHICDF